VQLEAAGILHHPATQESCGQGTLVYFWQEYFLLLNELQGGGKQGRFCGEARGQKESEQMNT